MTLAQIKKTLPVLPSDQYWKLEGEYTAAVAKKLKRAYDAAGYKTALAVNGNASLVFIAEYVLARVKRKGD